MADSRQLLRNNSLEEWAAGDPVSFTVTSTNGSHLQLDRRTMDKRHPEYQVIPIDRTQTLVFDGDSAIRFKGTSSAVVGDLSITPSVLTPVRGKGQYVASAWIRGNRHLLRLNVSVLVGATTFFFDPVIGEWVASAKGWTILAIPQWKCFSSGKLEPPAGAISMNLDIANDDSGVQDFDIDNIFFEELSGLRNVA